MRIPSIWCWNIYQSVDNVVESKGGVWLEEESELEPVLKLKARLVARGLKQR